MRQLLEKMKKIASLLSIGVFLLIPSSASAIDGIGGGASFDALTEIPYVAGLDSEIALGFFVQNLGDSEVQISLGGETPAGISYVPERETVLLRSGAVTNYEFNLRVGKETPPGEYELVPTIRPQINTQSEEGSTFIPGISGQVVAKVIGASAFVRIRAENFFTDEPVVGNLSLLYADTPTLPFKIAETEGSVLDATVVPGNYIARFDVPGVQTVDREFSIREGEDKLVVLEIKALQFTLASAQPIIDGDGNVFAADIVAAVRNDLTRIEAPTSIEMDVLNDGNLVETVTLAEFPEFPEGVSQQRLTYTPEGGFSSGLWEFGFKLKSVDFVLEAPEMDSFVVPSFLARNLWTILTVMAFLVLIGLAVPKRFWFLLFKKRRKDEDEEESLSNAIR